MDKFIVSHPSGDPVYYSGDSCDDAVESAMENQTGEDTCLFEVWNEVDAYIGFVGGKPRYPAAPLTSGDEDKGDEQGDDDQQ